MRGIPDASGDPTSERRRSEGREGSQRLRPFAIEALRSWRSSPSPRSAARIACTVARTSPSLSLARSGRSLDSRTASLGLIVCRSPAA